MKQNLELLPKLAEAVGGAQNQLLVSICNNFTDPRISAIYSKIARTINESTTYAKNPAHMVTQQCFAVHPGVQLTFFLFSLLQIDGLLDVARQTYVETVEGSSIFVFRESSFDQIFMNWSIPTPVNTDSNLKLPTLRKSMEVKCHNLTLFRGYYLTVGTTAPLPHIFLHPAQKGKRVTTTTAALMSLNRRNQEALADVLSLTGTLSSPFLF